MKDATAASSGCVDRLAPFEYLGSLVACRRRGRGKIVLANTLAEGSARDICESDHDTC